MPPYPWPGKPRKGWPLGPQLRSSTESNRFGNVPKCFTAYGNSGPSLPARNPTADSLSAVALRKNKTIDPTCYVKLGSELRTVMQLPGNFNKLTPMAKTDALQKSGEFLRLRNEFPENGAKLHILRSVQGSRLSVSSGINNYLRFCTMTDSTSPPPSSGTYA